MMFCFPASCVATCWVQLASADDGVLGDAAVAWCLSSVPSASATGAECCDVVIAGARSFDGATACANDPLNASSRLRWIIGVLLCLLGWNSHFLM